MTSWMVIQTVNLKVVSNEWWLHGLQRSRFWADWAAVPRTVTKRERLCIRPSSDSKNLVVQGRARRTLQRTCPDYSNLEWGMPYAMHTYCIKLSDVGFRKTSNLRQISAVMTYDSSTCSRKIAIILSLLLIACVKLRVGHLRRGHRPSPILFRHDFAAAAPAVAACTPPPSLLVGHSLFWFLILSSLCLSPLSPLTDIIYLPEFLDAYSVQCQFSYKCSFRIFTQKFVKLKPDGTIFKLQFKT